MEKPIKGITEIEQQLRQIDERQEKRWLRVMQKSRDEIHPASPTSRDVEPDCERWLASREGRACAEPIRATDEPTSRSVLMDRLRRSFHAGAGIALRRNAAFINARKTTCPRGHPYDRMDNRGRRICSRCDRANRH